MTDMEKPSADAEVIIYTDGACSGNPGPGGWAFILRHVTTGKTMEKTGATQQTTNNQMELQALTEGLQSLQRPTHVHVVTDSTYLKQGLTEWIQNWKRRGWKRKNEQRTEACQECRAVEATGRTDSNAQAEF